jgi:hypothetical protein
VSVDVEIRESLMHVVEDRKDESLFEVAFVPES